MVPRLFILFYWIPPCVSALCLPMCLCYIVVWVLVPWFVFHSVMFSMFTQLVMFALFLVCFSVFPPVCISVYFLFYSEGLCLMLVYSVLLPCLVVPNQFQLCWHLLHISSCSCLCFYSVCHLVLVAGSSVTTLWIKLTCISAVPASWVLTLNLHDIIRRKEW